MFEKNGLDLLPLRAMVDRLINAPHDVTHCIAGPKIKPYMAWLKSQWSYDSSLFYGGTTPDKLQAWLTRATSCGPKLVFWSDYSMFDASHNVDTWHFVEEFYQQHRHDVDFMRVLEVWRLPTGTIGDLRYQGRVMNASGRDDTALANALLNGIAMMLSVTAAWFRKPLRDVRISDLEAIKSELLLSVCGDDALGFLPACDDARALEFITDARAHLTAFGFKAKMFCSSRFEDAVYLGHRPLPVNGLWYWSRTIGRCIYKLGWQLGTRGDPSAHFLGIAAMHSQCSSHVPVLSDICKTWLSTRKGAKINHWKPDPNKPWERMGLFGPENYADDTIEALARAYTVEKTALRGDLDLAGTIVTAASVRECINYVCEVVREAAGRPCVLDHWLLRHMVVVDEQ